MAAVIEGTGVIQCDNNVGKQVFGLIVGIVSKFFPAASFAKGITCSGEGKQLVIYSDDRSSLKIEKNLAGFIVVLIVVLVVVKIFNK